MIWSSVISWWIYRKIRRCQNSRRWWRGRCQNSVRWWFHMWRGILHHIRLDSSTFSSHPSWRLPINMNIEEGILRSSYKYQRIIFREVWSVFIFWEGSFRVVWWKKCRMSCDNLIIWGAIFRTHSHVGINWQLWIISLAHFLGRGSWLYRRFQAMTYRLNDVLNIEKINGHIWFSLKSRNML